MLTTASYLQLPGPHSHARRKNLQTLQTHGHEAAPFLHVGLAGCQRDQPVQQAICLHRVKPGNGLASIQPEAWTQDNVNDLSIMAQSFQTLKAGPVLKPQMTGIRIDPQRLRVLRHQGRRALSLRRARVTGAGQEPRLSVKPKGVRAQARARLDPDPSGFRLGAGLDFDT